MLLSSVHLKAVNQAAGWMYAAVYRMPELPGLIREKRIIFLSAQFNVDSVLSAGRAMGFIMLTVRDIQHFLVVHQFT
ncbi:hypothetical protein CSK29544_01931 [Cronobacter sakazakii]|nr:hypothetical protein CSK29544_01931 [Cronobacter sakazakii]